MYPRRIFYRIDAPPDNVPYMVDRLIEKTEANSFPSHMKGFFDRYNGQLIKGEIEKNKFTFWRTNVTWNGILYPVFIGEITKVESTNEMLLKMKVRLNPIAELMCGLFILFFSYSWITEIVLSDTLILGLIPRIIGGVILCLLMLSVPIITFIDLKNQTLEGIKSYFNLKEVKIKKKGK